MTDPESLRATIEELRQRLAATPPDHPDRASLLSDLGTIELTRFGLVGDLADLDAAIAHLSESVAATDDGDPQLAGRLMTLVEALRSRHARTGDPADLAAADRYRREVDLLIPLDQRPPRPSRPASPPEPDGDEWQDRSGGLDDEAFGATPPAPAPPAPAGPPGYAGLPEPADEPATGGWIEQEQVRQPEQRPAPQPVPVPAQRPDEVARERKEAASAPHASAPDADAPAGGSAAPSSLEFAAAHRRAIERGQQYPLLFFVHRPADRDLVRDLIERRAPQLGGGPAVSHGIAAQAVRSGTTLTIVPSVLGATFAPQRRDIIVDDTVRELTFQMTVPGQTPVGPMEGYVDIFIGPLIIGQVPVSFEVHEASAILVQQAGAQLMAVANATVFDKIFISYSHKNADVVDACVQTYHGVGVQTLVDHIDLRSGEDWRAGLERMIRESDIFQLYWSAAAAASPEVEKEWRLALSLAKSRDRFIRPLYWETPMPSAPDELDHLHFSKFDVKSLRRAGKAAAPGKPGFLRRTLGSMLSGRSR